MNRFLRRAGPGSRRSSVPGRHPGPLRLRGPRGLVRDPSGHPRPARARRARAGGRVPRVRAGESLLPRHDGGDADAGLHPGADLRKSPPELPPWQPPPGVLQRVPAYRWAIAPTNCADAGAATERSREPDEGPADDSQHPPGPPARRPRPGDDGGRRGERPHRRDQHPAGHARRVARPPDAPVQPGHPHPGGGLGRAWHPRRGRGRRAGVRGPRAEGRRVPGRLRPLRVQHPGLRPAPAPLRVREARGRVPDKMGTAL